MWPADGSHAHTVADDGSAGAIDTGLIELL
jgi:hypothetical protein